MNKRLYAPVGPFVVALAFAISSVGCGSSAHHSSNPTAPTHTTPASALNRIAAICTQMRQRVAAIPKPATNDPSNPAAIRYEKRLLTIFDQMVSNITSAAQTGQSAASLRAAIAAEERGQKLVDAQIPALEHHDLARANQLAAQARALTAPADATMRQAGLGICVGQ